MSAFQRVHMPSLDGATGWVKSDPLGPAELRGAVVLVNFWTLTCINWLRQEPFVRAWSQAYRDDGLLVVGVHTPEFSFEHDIGGVRQAVEVRDIDYPVARSASSSACSAWSASSSPSEGSAWRRRPTGTTCKRPRPTSAMGAASSSRQRTTRHSTNGGSYELPQDLGLNRWALAGEWTIGREAVASSGPAAASPCPSRTAPGRYLTAMH
jgi:thiol-disulfide isomerase/thioredoxin